MKNGLLFALIFFALLTSVPLGRAATGQAEELLVLCYHSIQASAREGDRYTISHNRFAEQMDYLQTHGYRPVALKDLVAAHQGKKALPQNAVLLTFDDGYRSYADFVVPLLDRYGFPSMLAVVGRWIESGPPQGLPEPLLNWSQIKRLIKNPRVTIASHSYDLHKATRYTPQGNVGAVVGVRAYLAQDRRYETEEEYRRKLRLDFRRQETLFMQRLGCKPQAMVWPYGHDNAVSLETARAFGLEANFVLDEKGQITTRLADMGRLHRVMVPNGPIERFIFQLQQAAGTQEPVRAVQVDLDLVYSPQSAQETDRNLGRLIERLVRLKVNTVFLQAFADPDGTGNISRMYFNNRFLPVRADIFAHAVHQMKIRGIKVFAWMPVLSYRFADSDFNQRHKVRGKRAGGQNGSGYQRLSPFSPEVQARVAGLFADLANGAQISGVLFQDDAYLSDDEDFHPHALAAFEKHVGRKVACREILPGSALEKAWVQFKTRALITFVDGLIAAVRRYRPDALFARNLYARLLAQPEAEQWFAQNYDRFLETYDYVVVMAYPRMEQAARPLAWLGGLASTPVTTRAGVQKTIFKLQTYDWQRNQWIPEPALLKQMRAVLAAGVRHLAYYPDNFWEDKPDTEVIRLEMSTLSWIGGE